MLTLAGTCVQFRKPWKLINWSVFASHLIRVDSYGALVGSVSVTVAPENGVVGDGFGLERLLPRQLVDSGAKLDFGERERLGNHWNKIIWVSLLPFCKFRRLLTWAMAGNCDDGGFFGVTFAVRGEDLDLVAAVGQAFDLCVRGGGLTQSKSTAKLKIDI